MSDHKIDCTRPSGGIFRVITACFKPTSVLLEVLLQQIQSLLKNEQSVHLIQVFDITNEKDAEAMIAWASVQKPQGLIMLTSADTIPLSKVLSATYNEHFHNSPNILFIDTDRQMFEETFKTHPSYDIGINSNPELLVKLLRNIALRTHNDDPIDFGDLKGLAYRAHGPVHFV